MSLRIPSVADVSERRMSNIDDFLDSDNEDQLLNNVNWLDIYNLKAPSEVSKIFAESTIVAQDIIEKILNDGAEIMYNKYIQDKMGHHSILRTLHLQTMGLEGNFIDYDDKNKNLELEGMLEDQEPQTSGTEHWKRNAMQVEIKQIVVQPQIQDNQSEVSQSRMSIKSGSKSFIGASKIRLNKTITSQNNIQEEIQYKYTLIDKTVKQEFDMEEDQYRKAKERDIKIKYDQEMQRLQREKELKEQQMRLKNLPNDLKKTSYTYDFDGKVLPLSGMNIEKLGPLVTNVGHSYSKESHNQKSILQNSNQFKEKAEAVQEQVSNQKRASQFAQQMDQLGGGKQDDKNNNFFVSEQQIKQLMSQPKQNISEHIQMNPGVTFIQEQVVKSGTDYRSTYDLSNAENLMNPNISIKMTKNEYLDITRGGNLSRSEEQGYTRRSQQNYKPNNYQQKIDEEEDFTVDYKNQDILKELNQKSYTQRQRPKKKPMESSGTIKPNAKDKRLYKNFNDDIINNTQPDDFDFNSLTIQTQPNISTGSKQKFNNTDQSILDSFNMNLITHGSKVSEKKSELVLPRIATKKPNQKILQSTLGKLSKLPRDRIGKTAYQVHSKSLSLLPPHQLKQYKKIKQQQLESQQNSQFEMGSLNNTINAAAK